MAAPTTSRYLARLETGIASAGEGAARDCLLAERAAYLARLGRMVEAKDSIAVLQSHYRASPKAEVNVWILFADAMGHHFDHLGAEARDRLLRAQAISSATGLRRIDALSSAWLAQLDYARNDFTTMDRNLRRAFGLASADDHLVLARATMVVGLAFHFADRSDLAEPWMRRCRTHNVELGDDATWSATLHNTAWCRLISLRQRRAEGVAVSEDYSFTRMSVESAIAFDEMTRAGSLQILNDVLQAQVASLVAAHTIASELHARIIPQAMASGLGQWLPILLADAAVSAAALGQVDRATTLAEQSQALLASGGHPDDIASARSRLVDFYEAVGEAHAASEVRRSAALAWAEHRAKQQQIVSLLLLDPAIGS